MATFTVCVLGFGSHVDLLTRCVSSIARRLPSPHVAEVRIAINAPTEALRDAAEDLRRGLDAPSQLLASAESPKYPTMRRTFQGISTPWIMWFDDDSFVRDDFAGDPFAHYARVGENADIIGRQYRIRPRPGQDDWLRKQPWYAGVEAGHFYRFMTGGWWAARADLLRRHDYPWPELYHNGGDVMLGQLALQQGWRRANDPSAICINADAAGVDSKSPRRGLNTKPIGSL